MGGNAETMRERNNGSEEEPQETCRGGGATQGARAATLGWARPLRSLLQFTGANLVFWFLALTSWRVYHLISLTLLGLVFTQMMKDLVLARVRGAQLWRSLSASWEVMDSKPQCRPRLTQCIADSWSSCTVFLQELSLFKQQNPGKFCLLVCGLCTFLTILGSYIPGVVLSYFLLLCAFLYPLIKCNEFGQKIYNRIKPALPSLDFGFRNYFRNYFSQRSKERSENPKDDESELDLSALCPKVSPLVAARELSVSDTEPSEVSWTDNGTFNLSEGHTPQTDTSDDFDRRSDQEAFARDLANFPSLDTGTNDDDSDSSLGLPVQGPGAKAPEENDHKQSAAGLYLPLASDQALHLASDMVAAAVSAAVREQLQSALQRQAPTAEDMDADEADDFELLDQSELEQMEEDLGLAEGQEASQGNVDKKPSSFLSHLLGGH